MSAARARRLPGFRFETQAPPLPEVLPRMDIAVFIGFAASGPLQIPVAIESEAQFAAIFGEDAPLAWDVERGEQINAHLAPAVRAFFRNSGQRCWVIRVARQKAKRPDDLNRARYNYFPIPGLARAEFDSDGRVKRLTPAFARARSEGSWSDPIRVGSALLSRPAQVNGSLQAAGPDYVMRIARDSSEGVGVGELLRLDFKDDGYFAFMAVKKVGSVYLSPPASPPSFPQVLEVTASKTVWFQVVSEDDVGLPAPDTAVKAAVFTRETTTSPPTANQGLAAFEALYDAVLSPNQDTLLDDDKITLKLLNCALADAPAPGSVIRIDVDAGQWWMTVDTLDFTAGDDGVPLVSGQAFRPVDAPTSLPTSTPACERLSFEIWVRKAEEYSVSLSDLGFAAEHERYWAKLPGDEELYRDSDPTATENPATVLWNQTGDLFRFPLAGIRNAGEVYFPLTMPALAENFLGPVVLTGDELERNGLAEFDANLFMDRDLVAATTETLAGQAEFLQYLAPEPRHLTGMHAAFALEEATIVAVPDAIHYGWFKRPSEPLPEAGVSLPPLRPEWWHFLDCHQRAEETPPLSDCDPKPPAPSPIKPVHVPEWGNFLKCAIRIIEPPNLAAFPQVSTDGTFTLAWESSPPAEAKYLLEESANSDFSDAVTIYSGTPTSFTLYGRRSGDYFYRVRTIVGEDTSDWSNGVAVRVEESARWALKDKKDYSPDVLLAVQRSLLRMCAARGDLLCVLSLPEHYRDDKAIEHTMLLKATPNLVPPTQGVTPLNFGEVKDFTYGAAFHPWLIESEQSQRNDLVRMPPCGAVSGLIADRALRRGAWLAPANQPLRGVVALEPPLLPERRLALQEGHINLVRQEPRGFVVLDSDTLSDDVDLRQINVRRLLILLRRQALRLGATYVFEPNSPSFRRMVERGFTEMLDGMFERGAFAGATPSSSYQVVTDESLNTAESVDQGRFIVELRVAPSFPMTFLTIRLIQTSDRSLALEVR